MNILLLGPERKEMVIYLESLEDAVKTTDQKITSSSPLIEWADYIISYGYRHIIRQKVIDLFPRRAINLHIAYLPWCRGSYPNLWSFLNDTPKGVTIHYLDAGVDTGDIIAQEKVEYKPDDTLRSSQERLIDTVEKLLYKKWPEIKSGCTKSTAQPADFPVFRKKDREQFKHLLKDGWDTPVAGLIGRGLRKADGNK